LRRLPKARTEASGERESGPTRFDKAECSRLVCPAIVTIGLISRKDYPMDFILRLAVVYAGLFGAIGVQLPFLPVWFAAKGLDERSIGAVLAFATILRVAVVPFGTRAADRFGQPHRAILVVTGCGTLALTALGFAGSTTAVFLLYGLAAAAGATALPLIESYALRGLAERGRAYGPVRLWGSAAFIIGTLVTGALLAWMAPLYIIWVLVAVYGSAALASIRLMPLAAAQTVGERPSAIGLLRDRRLLAVIAAAALIQGSHALLYGFGSLQWTAAGLSGLAIGTLWSLGVVAEIVLFAVSGRFPPGIGPLVLMAVGAAGATVRWAAMALDPSPAWLPALQLLHALSFGATHLGAVQLVARLAPTGLSATAQGLLATGIGIAMASAMALSGLLQGQYGATAYLAMALMAAAGGATLLRARMRETA
jgi:MFS transporter, PPP family, 3-phenylpropionic acid transporter